MPGTRRVSLASILRPLKDPSSPNLDEKLADLKLAEDGLMTTVPGALSHPFVSGRWETFDHGGGSAQGWVLMRVLLHNNSDTSDVKVSWISDTCMKLSIRRPELTSDARQLAGCLMQQDGPFIQCVLNLERTQCK